MAEQSRYIYNLTGCASVQDMERQMNYLLQSIADRLDQVEGLRGVPTFNKSYFNIPGLASGQVLKATSSTRAALSALDVSEVTDAVPNINSGSTAQVDLERSLISLIDSENDYVVHQFPTQWLEYNCEVFQFTTHENFETLAWTLNSDNSIAHQIEEDAVDGIIEGDGSGNYSAVTNLPGYLLVDVYDFNDEIIHQYPLEFAAQSSELFGFY